MSALKDQPTSQVPVILGLPGAIEQSDGGSQFGQKGCGNSGIYRLIQESGQQPASPWGSGPWGAPTEDPDANPWGVNPLPTYSFSEPHLLSEP